MSISYKLYAGKQGGHCNPYAVYSWGNKKRKEQFYSKLELSISLLILGIIGVSCIKSAIQEWNQPQQNLEIIIEEQESCLSH